MIFKNARLVGKEGRWTIVCESGKIKAIHQENDGSSHLNSENSHSVVDLEGQLVTRSFADVHMHLDKAYNSEVKPNQSGTLGEAIEIGQALKEETDVASVYEKMLRGARQALVHGTTRLRTHVDVDPIARLTGVEAGVKAREALADWVQMEIVAFPQEGITGEPGVFELLDESLRMGCDAIGGIPANDPDPRTHIEKVFDLAEKHAVPVDMHVDESDDPNDLTLLDCIDVTNERGFGGRVAAGHCCSLSAQEPQRRQSIIEQVADAGIHMITLPSTNLYLQGRDDAVNPRRGLMPVKELLASGVNVTYGSDNVRDPFNPFGNANMVEGALILAHAGHMGGREEIAQVFDMGTRRSVALLDSLGDADSLVSHVDEGDRADFLVWDAPSSQAIVVNQARPRFVVVAGNIVVEREAKVKVSEDLP